MKLKALLFLLCCVILLSIPSEKTFAAARFSVLPDFFNFDSTSNVASWPGGAEATCNAVTVYVSYPQNENPLGIPTPIYDYVDWSLTAVLDKDGNTIPSETGLIYSFPAGTTAGEQHSATFNFTNPLQAGQSYYLRMHYDIVGGSLDSGSDSFDMGAVGTHPYWQFRAGDNGSSNSFFCDPAIEADPPTVSLLGDVLQLEGDSGAVVYNATLFLDKPINEPVIVDIGSRDAADLPAYSATFPSFNGYGTRGIQFGTGVCIDSGDPSCIVPEYSTVTIPAGQTSVTVPVNLFGDTSYTWTYPVRDNYDLYIVRAGNALIGNMNQINLSQRNDDPCVAGPDPDCNRTESNPGGTFPVSADPVTFTVSNVVVDEDDGNAVFTVNLSVPNPLSSLTISYTTTSGNRTATENVDYVATSGNLVFTSGQTSQQVSVPLILNAEAEDIETFGMTFAKVGTNDAESATVGAMIIDVYDACPDGTPNNDTLVCEGTPPIGTNTDATVDAGAGSDTVSIQANVTGSVLAQAGNDTVILQDGAGGGGDNTLPINGGADTDTLDFDFTSLTQNQIDALYASNPADGSVTIGGQTFTFTNFEFIAINGTQIEQCPDGTPNNDTIVCHVSPPVASNTDGDLHGNIGGDNITVNDGVHVDRISGDLDALNLSPSLNGGNDTITNSGIVQFTIVGDGIWYEEEPATGYGGDDYIHNTATGQVYLSILGDDLGTYTAVNGDDTIINEGLVLGNLSGDGTASEEVFGGDDIINNSGTVNSILGDSVVASVAGSSGGNDTITNSGLIDANIYGDYVRGRNDVSVIAGEDSITNSGTVAENIYGDYIYGISTTPSGEGSADTITNSGTVGGTIYAEGGDDTVILQDGANGGGDNILPLDGGIGTDILRFSFTGLTDQQAEQILAQDPANGSAVIGGQTFNFTNFESLEVTGYVPSNLVQFNPNGTINTGYGNPNYSWSDTGANNYELYVTRVGGGQNINPTVARAGICNTTTCSIDLTVIAEANRLLNGSYQWYVREAGGTWIGPKNFILNAAAPALVTMGTTSGVDNLKPTFHWTLSGTATNATYFRVYVVSTATPAVVKMDQWFTRLQTCGSTSATTCSLLSPVGLTSGVQYQVYVQSYGPGGVSTGGASGFAGPDTFTINATFPSPISPSGTLNLPQGNPTYTWTDIAGADYYYLYVANAANQQVINEVVSDVGYCNGAQCQIDATTLRESYRLQNGLYTFYVRGWKNGQPTLWSAGMSFTVNSTLPDAVTQTFPLQGDSTDYDMTFQWNEVANVAGYNLYLLNPNGGNSGVLRGEVGDEVTCSAGVCSWDYIVPSIPGIWTWYVQAFNSAGAGAWAGPITFSAPTPLPDAIAKIAPSQNEALSDSDTTFLWTADGDATQYQLYIMGPNGWISDVTYTTGQNLTCSTDCSVDITLPYNGAYSYYLRGRSEAGWGAWSVGGAADGYGLTTFTVTDTLPSIISKIQPTQAQNLLDLNINFTWNADPNATYYQLYVTGPNNTIVDQTLMVGTGVTCTSTCQKTVTLPVNGAYTWYVRGYNGAGWGPWSTGTSFTVGQLLPDVITKTSPTTNAALTSLFVTFSWQIDNAATKYEFYITGPNSYAFNQVYVVDTDLFCDSNCVLDLILPANGAYTWYVRGGNAAGFGLWDAGQPANYGGVPFTADQPLPAVIAKTGPDANEIVTNIDMIFDWTPDIYATKYELYITGPNGFTSDVVYTVGTDVTCTSSCAVNRTLPANGAYNWYLRGGNAAGWGAWSAGGAADGYGPVAFTVNMPLPVAPTLNTPANDAIIYQTNRPTFSWNTVATATYYRLLVTNGVGIPVFDQWLTTASVCPTSTCSFRLPNPIAFGGYTWSVQAYNIAGVGAVSATRSFLSLSFNLQPLMVQVENGQITRSGAWTQATSESAMGQAYLQSSISGADTLTMTFTGTQVDVIYVAGAEYGTFVVEIDGEPLRGVNANATQTAFGQIASFTDLADGEHTLRIVPLGGAPVAIDALVVNGQVLTTQPQPIEPVETETPIVIPVQPTDDAPIVTPEPEVTEEVIVVPVQPEVTEQPTQPAPEVTDEP